MKAAKTSRLFYALWPDAATRTALATLCAQLPGNRMSPDNLHLTLAFLGQQPQTLLPVLKKISAALPPLDAPLHIDYLGFFKRRRIVWAGLHNPPAELFALQETLAQQLRQHHITFDDSPAFKPHITLARDSALPHETAITPIHWVAGRIVLVESISRPEGVQYRVLGLKGGWLC
ncbi:MAG: RNA 2',3'-cyclic phosphodiesterase [Burkholderiaceae bacterium]|nr:MAG: RNA 2',3'-cyclic phosphodiesterase [Burkholderiaceae bacterium]